VFLLWSYVHIVSSVALSEAHPAWIVRLFKAPTAAWRTT